MAYGYSPRGSNSRESNGYRGRRGERGGRRNGEGRREEGGRKQGRNQTIKILPYECPLDSNGAPVTVPLRFEVIKKDGGSVEERDRMKRLYTEEMMNTARYFGVEIIEMSEIQETPVPKMDHSRWVCHLQVRHHRWQHDLAYFAFKFLDRVQNSGIGTVTNFEMPLLCVHSPLIFPLKLVNTHFDIPIANMKFGSFLNNGAIAIHWDVAGGQSRLGDNKLGFDFYKDIKTSMEYDRRQITTMFQNREIDPFENSGIRYLTNYKLTVNMSSIRRIFFHQIENPDGGNRECSLVFLVDYMPKIQAKLKNTISSFKSPNGNQHQGGYNANRSPHVRNGALHDSDYDWGQYKHRLYIERGKYPGERSNRVALHECKVIVFQFDLDEIKEKLEDGAVMDEIFYDILMRLRHKTGKVIEFCSFQQLEMIEGHCRDSNDVYDKTLYQVRPFEVQSGNGMDAHSLNLIKGAAARLCLNTDDRIQRFQHAHRIEIKTFRLLALLEGILQRGMELRCQLLNSRDTWYAFVQLVAEKYMESEQKLLFVMESLLAVVSEGRQHCSIEALFWKEWEESRSAERTSVFSKEEERKGYTRLMKFVVTPTRLIFVGYETLMANRVLHQYSKNGTEIVRVSFRDDNGEYMRKAGCGDAIMLRTMRDVLLEGGLIFAGRKYVWLGNSNSQLRDHGMYMVHETDGRKASEIRKKLGNFHLLTSIPKWLARQGQCFTQARTSEYKLSATEVGMIRDFTGGMTDAGKMYVFSDGVGTISYELAASMSNEHELVRTASAFQIRHKGQKGLVQVDPMIDERNEVLSMMGRDADKKKVYVRPSMDKFEVDETARNPKDGDHSNLEIVKFSMPSPLFLNKPMLNILSQTTEDQSSESHVRISSRVKELLDNQLRNVCQSLFVESKAREAVKEMSFPFAMEVFSDSCALKLTSEPFFQSMLRANAKFVLNKQLSKMQIRIPSDCGRSMFGVVDTTGILQYGQIFCQYSTSTSKHLQNHTRQRRGGGAVEGANILTCPVMITKNPCIEKGDIRRFQAIDVPGLRHLVDVVVFPMHGPRPHPDEMAGSDLDGDEFSLIWDQRFLFDRNEEASLFPTGEDVVKWPIIKDRTGAVDMKACERRLVDFYCEAIMQEQIGVLSNAHLATSDFYGLNAKPSRSLAMKISQSLDFQKNGVPPNEITTKCMEDPDDPTRVIPPEKSERKPDYMEKRRDAVYESRGIMGKIYKEIKRYQNALDTGEENGQEFELDNSFDIPEWEKFSVSVRREYEEYAHAIRAIMEHYGIETEGELMSGQILSIKNRISEKEHDDMNMYNTYQVIEEKVKTEIEAAREKFFKTFLNWESELNEVQNKRRDVQKNSILSRVIGQSTVFLDKIRQKAAAAYHITYRAASAQLSSGVKSGLILSFPWIVYDVLADMKLRPDERIQRVLPMDEEEREQSNEPLAVILSSLIDDFCEKNRDEFEQFERRFRMENGEEEKFILNRMMRENKGLVRAAFVMLRWAESIGFRERKFTQNHLLALFLFFGLGECSVKGAKRRYIQRPSGEIRQHQKKGEHLLRFIEYCSSREFRARSSLSFADIAPGVLLRGEWKEFSELAIPSYLSLITTHQLRMADKSECVNSQCFLKEYEPRRMELPRDLVDNPKRLDEVREMLMKVTGCTEVQLRNMGGDKTTVFVSAIGSASSFEKLNYYIIPTAPTREQATLRETSSALPNLIYQRLSKAAAAIATVSS